MSVPPSTAIGTFFLGFSTASVSAHADSRPRNAPAPKPKPAGSWLARAWRWLVGLFRRDRGEEATAIPDGPPGNAVVVVWQGVKDTIAETGTLDPEGRAPHEVPPGATARLVAYVGGALHVVRVGERA